MKARTDTNCKECMHRKVCHKFDRPIDAVEKLLKVTGIHDNGIDIVVTCPDFDNRQTLIKRELAENRKDLIEEALTGRPVRA